MRLVNSNGIINDLLIEVWSKWPYRIFICFYCVFGIYYKSMWAGEVKKDVAALIVHTHPLCKFSDMPEEMTQEAIETCVTAVEKYSENYEQAARMIKDNLDKKFGPPFQIIVGEAYSCAITHQEKSLLHMFIGGNIAVLVWKTITNF